MSTRLLWLLCPLVTSDCGFWEDQGAPEDQQDQEEQQQNSIRALDGFGSPVSWTILLQLRKIRALEVERCYAVKMQSDSSYLLLIGEMPEDILSNLNDHITSL